MSQQKDYESTVMRIAGNLLSGSYSFFPEAARTNAVAHAVATARAIIAEVKRTAEKVEVPRP